MDQVATNLSLPGKVFLFGEYAVLRDGPAILAMVPPRFRLQASAIDPKNSAAKLPAPFAEGSPAELYLRAHPAFFSAWKLDFSDPYHSRGGFGRSSAEFALAYLFHQKTLQQEASVFELAWKAREEFRKLTKSPGKVSPSGVDVIAQMADRMPKHLLMVDSGEHVLQELSGIPEDLHFYFFPSGRKQPTHTHLANLEDSRLSELGALNEITRQVARSLLSQPTSTLSSMERTQQIGEAMTRYSDTLASLKLVDDAARADLDRIRKLPGVLGAKGCGALGIDVYAVGVHRSDSERFLRSLDGLGYPQVYDFQRSLWFAPDGKSRALFSVEERTL